MTQATIDALLRMVPVIIALGVGTGGGTAATYFTGTRPALEKKAEIKTERDEALTMLVQANETYRDLYGQCLEDLRVCRNECR